MVWLIRPSFIATTNTLQEVTRGGRKVGTGIHLEEIGRSSNAFTLVLQLLLLRGQ